MLNRGVFLGFTTSQQTNNRLRMNRTIATITLVLLAICALVSCHGLLVTPTPRKGTTDFNVGTAPCGKGLTKSTTVATYTAGEKATVSWKINANHGGTISLNIIDIPSKNTAYLAAGIKAVGGVNNYEVVIPSDISCSNCTFQWIWIPDPNQEKANYYGCADISILSTGSASMIGINGSLTVLLSLLITLVMLLA